MAEYEAQENPANIQAGDHPRHKMLMAWGVNDEQGHHEITYHHGALGGTATHNFLMHDKHTEDFVGSMGLANDGRIQHIEVHPDLRRQGLATKLYKFGQDIHDEIDSIPAPKHSKLRTDSGNAWASAVGGDSEEGRISHVPDEDYMHNRWPVRTPEILGLKAHVNEFHAKMVANGLDEEGTASARALVDTIHHHLDEAHNARGNAPKKDRNLQSAHAAIDDLGDIHADHYGDMEDHEKLQEHIGKLY